MVELPREPFRKYNLDGEKEKPDTFTIRFNKEERAEFNEDKKIIEQSKDSTALKQLARIGHFVIHDKIIGAIILTLFKNKKNNKRLNIVEFE